MPNHSLIGSGTSQKRLYTADMPKIARRALVASAAAAALSKAADPGIKFASWKIEDLEAKRQNSGKPWHQFFDNQTMFMGVYSLAASATDGQGPHKEDEIYYVVAGKAKFRAGEEETSVEKGSVLFVKAGVSHKFHTIEQALEVLVFFSKAKP